MLTRIEIDGFKTFEKFSLDLRPFTAIVGPNASGKSNLFDAVKLISLLSQTDVRTAMQDMRGEPEELFRRIPGAISDKIVFAVEVLLNETGKDSFGTPYRLRSQRLRYELEIQFKHDSKGSPEGIYVRRETCSAIGKSTETSDFLRTLKWIKYGGNLAPFIRMKGASADGSFDGIEIRQDGELKRGRPITLPANEASRSALSTVTTAEFPHLYALKELLGSINFLEINPNAARRPSDRFESRTLRPDASNLSAVLAKLHQETSTEAEPEGVLADIATDLSSLINAVRGINVKNDRDAKEYSFTLRLLDDIDFSSRVISDGTLRLLALLTALNDPNRKGVLCFEEPENGVHEARIGRLVALLRQSTALNQSAPSRPLFQIVVNTHSPVVMGQLEDEEIVVADLVSKIIPQQGKRLMTRMRTGIVSQVDMFNPQHLTRYEADNLLKRHSDGV